MASGWQNRVFKADGDLHDGLARIESDYVKACLKAYGPLTHPLEADNDFYPNPAAIGQPPGGDRRLSRQSPGENAPGGGYWIVKNSWGRRMESFCGPDYDAIAYASQPSYEDWSWINIFGPYNQDVTGLTGPVNFTGPSATVSWTGGSGVWSLGGNTWSGTDMYGNYLPNYAWDNFEPTPRSTPSGSTNVTINGRSSATA